MTLVPSFDWKIDVDGIQLFTQNLITDCTNRCNKIASVTELTIDNVLQVLKFTESHRHSY